MSAHIGILGVDKKGEEFYQLTLGGSAEAEDAEARPGRWVRPCRPTRSPTRSTSWSRSICASARTASASSTPSAAPASRPSRRPSMPTLIRWTGQARRGGRRPVHRASPTTSRCPQGDVIVSLQPFQAEGERLLAEGRERGRARSSRTRRSRTWPPTCRGSRWWPWPSRSSATARPIQRRPHPARAVRLSGRDEGGGRCAARAGPASWSAAASTPSSRPTAPRPTDWTHAAGRFRHVYQRAADGREPAFAERAREGVS